MSRELKFHQAILEATDQCLAADPRVYLMGLGVPDPKGTFGTTLGLQKKYGERRVMDMPTSENAMTGIAIGSALRGMRPLMTHQRVDFVLLALDQIINNAAKWHYMFGGQLSVPLVIRLVMGRGWGQGPQHSQSLQSIFAHVPGLKVVMPTTPQDAKGLLIASIEDNNPVIFMEHRWLHGIHGEVPEAMYRVPLGRARVARAGSDVTIVASSHMTLESLRAAELLDRDGIDAEVIDLRTIRPLDRETILTSVRKTGRLVVADADWAMCGVSAEVLALASESAFSALRAAPRRVTLPDAPTPTSWRLANHYYPRAAEIAAAVSAVVGKPAPHATAPTALDQPLDVPDPSFTGPF